MTNEVLKRLNDETAKFLDAVVTRMKGDEDELFVVPESILNDDCTELMYEGFCDTNNVAVPHVYFKFRFNIVNEAVESLTIECDHYETVNIELRKLKKYVMEHALKR